MLDHRSAAFGRVAPALARLGDGELAALVEAGVPGGDGIGGRTSTLDVDGVAVFVKQVPLTDTEAAAPHDTGNLFGLPAFYQYGVGSAGFGAWRELAAHRLTTDWVRSGRHAGFPLLYHWRVLPHTPAPGEPVDEQVAYWDGSPAVRRRLTQLRDATVALTLFLERIPHGLGEWLTPRLRDGRACADVAGQLHGIVAAMNRGGLLHFDAHFGNLLTDGRQVYVTDFGLALHESFARTPAEAAFHRAHESYDRRYTMGHLATWLVHAYRGGGDWDGSRRLVEACATGVLPPPLDGAPDPARRLILRHAATAATMNAFFDALVRVSKHTPYPYRVSPPGAGA
jgi:hypothetical protein